MPPCDIAVEDSLAMTSDENPHLLVTASGGFSLANQHTIRNDSLSGLTGALNSWVTSADQTR